MAAQLIDGVALSQKLREKFAHETQALVASGTRPGLAVILVGDDPASQVYVRNKGQQTVEVGMASFEHKLDASTSEADLLALIAQLNADPKVHGILVQLPLPKHVNSDLVINSIDPAKDVDGFHISNVGLLGTGQKSMVPCTPFKLNGSLSISLMPPSTAGRYSGLQPAITACVATVRTVAAEAGIADARGNMLVASAMGATAFQRGLGGIQFSR